MQVDGLADEGLSAIEEPVVVPLLVEALGQLQEVCREFRRVEVAAEALYRVGSAETATYGRGP